MNSSQVAVREEHTPQQPMLYHELANLFPLLEGDAAERERSLAKLRAGRDALSQLLEACGAE